MIKNIISKITISNVILIFCAHVSNILKMNLEHNYQDQFELTQYSEEKVSVTESNRTIEIYLKTISREFIFSIMTF